MVTIFDVAGFPVAHDTMFEVNTTITASLLSGTKAYVGLFEPTFVPFTFHWYTGVVPPLVGVAV
jgi:hypothetical protein